MSLQGIGASVAGRIGDLLGGGRSEGADGSGRDDAARSIGVGSRVGSGIGSLLGGIVDRGIEELVSGARGGGGRAIRDAGDAAGFLGSVLERAGSAAGTIGRSIDEAGAVAGGAVGGRGDEPAAADEVAVPNGSASGDGLTVKGDAITDEQLANLETVLDTGASLGANEKVLESAVATVIQESVAHNLDHGDRDSLGLFQQRPSQGWGTPDEVRDPVHASTSYFEQAIASDAANPDQSLTELAQSVQRSGFPDAYAQWEGEAEAIVDAWQAANG